MSDTVDPWEPVAHELDAMRSILERPRDARRLYAFADHVVRFVKAYHAALRAEGKTSIRVQAAEKALDLTTPKSALQAFVDPS